VTVDASKLQELAASLSEDQRRLLKEGLAGGENLDVTTLAATLNSEENQRILSALATDDGGEYGGVAANVLSADLPDGGTNGDGGVPNGGTHPAKPEPPLTRW
jgi:hypothetical protein